MSLHALDRIFQRYNQTFSWIDVRNIIKAIKKEKCYFVDAANNDCIVVLVNYEHIPLKLVYSSTKDHKGAIVTALPLDIDEWNSNLSQIPLIKREQNKKKKKSKKKKGDNMEPKETLDNFLNKAGVLTQDTFQGLLMHIESNGYNEERLETAYKDWELYYEDPSATNFNSIVCHLICKADSENLYRLAKGFPEHVRVFIEMQLVGNASQEKLNEVGLGENNE